LDRSAPDEVPRHSGAVKSLHMKTAIRVIALLLLLGLLSGPTWLPPTVEGEAAADAAGASAVAWWPMKYHDPQHTAGSPLVGPEAPHLKWSFDAGSHIMEPAVAAPDGTIYFVASDSTGNTLFALDPEGTLKWRYDLPHGEWVCANSLALGTDGTIYFGSGRTVEIREPSGAVGSHSEPVGFHALSPEGQLRLTFPADGMVAGPVVVGHDGTIYFSTTRENYSEGDPGRFAYLYALNPDSSVRWRYGADGWITYFAVAPGGEVYFTLWSAESLYALDTEGAPRWDCRMTEEVPAPVIGADGAIYLDAISLIVLDPDGSVRSVLGGEGVSVHGCPAIAVHGTIYAVGTREVKNDGRRLLPTLSAFGADGDVRWTYRPDDSEWASGWPIVDGAGTVYAGSVDGRLSAIANGTQKWVCQLGEDRLASPIIAGDGTLYVGSANGTLYAVGNTGSPVADGQTLGAWVWVVVGLAVVSAAGIAVLRLARR